jgi:DNA-binding response OmpR family regulator
VLFITALQHGVPGSILEGFMGNIHNNWKVLIVEDEDFFIELLDKTLQDNGFQTVIAKSGSEAWNYLSVKGFEINAVLLDRILPDMDGVDVLERIKSSSQLSQLPVIIQTVKNEPKDILEGIQSGAFYYLEKPFDLSILVALVKAACEDASPYLRMKEQLYENMRLLHQILKAEFRFQTLPEMQLIASHLSQISKKANNVYLGLSELMLNAIEHGNLGISFEEKTQLKIGGKWNEEVERRLSLEENRNKYAKLKVQKTTEKIIFTIEDEGKGFDWKPFMTLDPSRAFKPNGRGIYMALKMGFDRMEFPGSGNRVIAEIDQ